MQILIIKFIVFSFFIFISHNFVALFFSRFWRQFHRSLDAFNAILCIQIREKKAIRLESIFTRQLKRNNLLNNLVMRAKGCAVDHVLLEMHLRSWRFSFHPLYQHNGTRCEFTNACGVPIYNKTHRRILSSKITRSLTENLVFCSLFFDVIHRFSIRPLLFPREGFLHFPILLFTLTLSSFFIYMNVRTKSIIV